MRRIVLLCVTGLVMVCTAWAQQGTSEVRGTVKDQTGAVLPGVSITTRNQDTGLFRQTVSGEDGTYFVSGVIPGRYQIEAELPGFKRYQRGEIRLEVGKTTSVDMVLEVGAVTDEVSVTAESPLVDVSSKEVGGYIQSRELIDLPSVNRNFTGYIGLLPGVVASISTGSFGADSVNVNGQTVRNVNYTFDGASNNDSFNGGNGGSQARVPIEAVQEFQLLTSQFDAEFGQASGGIVNAVSKQGTNAWHGSAFAFYKDSALTAKDIFAKRGNLEKPNTQEQQYGGVIGGPIVRDKAHAFFSLERVLQDQGVTINIPARSEFNSAEFERTKVWNFLGRFDHQINAGHTWNIRWLRETSPQFNQSDDSRTKLASQQETDVDYTIVGGISSVFSPKTLNTFRIATTLEDVHFGNTQLFETGKRQAELLPTLNFLSFTHQQSTRDSRRIDRAWTGDEIFSWFVPDKWGAHDFKFGALYTYTPLRLLDEGTMNGRFDFSGNLDFDRNNPRTYPERFRIRIGAQNILLKSHQASWFIQDKWRINNRLTLTAGMRYELEIVPIPENDNPLFPDPRKYPVDKNNYSPRLGFSYVLDGSARTVLRGGYGKFFQTTSLTHLDNFFVTGVFSSSFIAIFPPNSADPGPSQGRLPTNPYLVNGPTVNRAQLAIDFPPGSRRRNVGTVDFDNPNRAQPNTQQVSIGFERQFWPNVSVSADYIRSWNRELYMRKDLNPGIRRTTGRTSTIDRVNPNFVSSVLQLVNTGRFEYDSLQTQIEKRFSNRFALRGSYTISKGYGNTGLGDAEQSSFQLLDDMRLDLNEGPTNIDRRHNLVISGTVDIPGTGGLRVSSVARAQSGTPFTIQDTNSDPDRNGILFDPLPPGSYSATGANGITVENKGGRNGAYGPGFFQLDLRAGYKFSLRESTNLEIFSEVFNLTNRSNFNNPSGDRRSTTHLIPTSLRGNGPTRTAQFGVRFSF